MLALATFFIFTSCGTFYKYFVKSNESTLLTAVTFILSLSSSFVLVLFIPIDIYLVSNGNLEISNLEINQKLISRFYHFMFWVLIFEAYVLIPFSYFCLKNRNAYKNEFDDNITLFENVIESLRKTVNRKENMEKGKELEYISDLLDMKHTGESAILFLMGCVVLVGVSFWVTYTSYGIACLPLSFLQQKNIEYDKREIENRFTNLKEKEMMIKNKYNKYNEMREKDKYEILKIEKMKRILSKYNYKLQEMEKLSESWLSYVIGIGLTFRVVTGLVFLTFSFVIYISLLAAITDKTLLVLCFLIIHIILVLIMTLLTIAPNYITYGVQKIKINDNIGYIKCSLKTDKNIFMYTFSLVYRIFFKKFSYLDSIDELDLNKENLDEHMNLLPLETLT
ncbi:hypothetical protein, conserved [Plasmodium ovale wallikeri]|uniref:LMBR1 domain-containing protein n=1 Tax=Plasmodium ovale wallikeri TaxID=864142 RepID=A0A1A8Z9M5_PLAOA|nr:hypothetical protein, conserved [Plasmodium ovale wallikeri]SBT40923.1 hypothetical protein, conserved [Plasmodium ovale wallikeri]